jgi:ATP-dependent Clp protease adaptor protein ClpS
MVSSYISVNSAVVGTSLGPQAAATSVAGGVAVTALSLVARRMRRPNPQLRSPNPMAPDSMAGALCPAARDIARMVLMPDSDGESLTPAGGTAIAERPVDEVLTQTPWVTIVWDDPVNLMSYVTHVFVTYFHYTKSKAEKLMLQVHTTGKAIVSSGSREAMERDVTAMHEYGLWATLDKSDK